MEAYDGTHSFYPPHLLDYDATAGLHPPDFDSGGDQPLNIDLDSFAGVDPHHPSSLLRRQFTDPSTFDDVFSDVVSNYDQPPPGHVGHEAKTPPLDTEDLRLKFSGTDFHYPLLDYAYRTAPVSIDAQLNGMFFSGILDSPPLDIEGHDATTKSVTCYRRNLFGITGNISIPRSLRYVSTDHQQQIPILSTEIVLSATESMEGAPVKLISVPFKSSNAPPELDDKVDKEPPIIPVDLMVGAEMDPGYATFPLNWKRLQFRSSTANNGRRKELQQHFILRISLRAMLASGQQATLCEISKGPVIVRGRSPRNFQPKGPTSGSISGRKPGMPRYAATDVGGNLPHVKSETDYQFDFKELGIAADGWHNRPNGHQGAITALPPDTFRVNPNEFFAQSSPDISRYTPQAAPAPVSLSLVEDEAKRPSPAPLEGGQRPKAPRLTSLKRPPSFSLGNLPNLGLNEEDSDPLYEYFPLGLDDWQEPVDAVYRPHVVHHIALPSSKGDTRYRSKRYFSDASPT